jgi:hypothetical protein
VVNNVNKRGSGFWDLMLGFSVGLLFAGAASCLLAELKHLIESGRAGTVIEILPTFDESLGGDHFTVGDGEMLDEMVARTQTDDARIRARRIYREQPVKDVPHQGSDGVYYDEE